MISPRGTSTGEINLAIPLLPWGWPWRKPRCHLFKYMFHFFHSCMTHSFQLITWLTLIKTYFLKPRSAQWDISRNDVRKLFEYSLKYSCSSLLANSYAFFSLSYSLKHRLLVCFECVSSKFMGWKCDCCPMQQQYQWIGQEQRAFMNWQMSLLWQLVHYHKSLLLKMRWDYLKKGRGQEEGGGNKKSK